MRWFDLFPAGGFSWIEVFHFVSYFLRDGAYGCDLRLGACGFNYTNYALAVGSIYDEGWTITSD